MPRPRTGLGQGLEALVPPLREDPKPFAHVSRPAQAVVAGPWEVATLEKRRGRRSGCTFTIAPAGILKKPRRRKLRGVSTLLALGALGAAGWELTAVSGKVFYLKRPVPVGVE